MPEMPVQQRAQGAYVGLVLDPHDGGPCGCDWNVPTTAAQLRHRDLPIPDQGRYGPYRPETERPLETEEDD